MPTMPYRARKGALVQTAKMTLDILQALAGAAPIPCVRPALQAVSSLIAVGEVYFYSHSINGDNILVWSENPSQQGDAQ
jgi:hypothetical protein